MEYGKLAYLKVEELEQRLRNLNFDTESGSAHFSASLNGCEGITPLAVVRGSGSVGFIAKITAPDSMGKKVAVLLGNSIIGETTLNSDGEGIIIGSVVLGEQNILSLFCPEYIALANVEVVFCGDASIISGALKVCAVGLGNIAAIASASAGKVRFSIVGKEQLDKGVDPAAGKFIGLGTCVALTATDGDFIAAYADGKILNLAQITPTGVILHTTQKQCPREIEDVAVWYGRGRCLVAYVVDGNILCRFVDPSLTDFSNEISCGIKADRVILGGHAPFIVYSDNGNCFFKQFRNFVGAAATAFLTATFDVFGRQ